MDSRIKLNEKQILEIKNLILSGEKQKIIAKKFHVTQSPISRIKNNGGYRNTGPNLSGKDKYWGYYKNPVIINKIIQTYDDGYTEKETAILVNDFVVSLGLKTRGKLCQENVHEILVMNNVKPRSRGDYPSPQPNLTQEQIDQIRLLRQQGYNINQTAKQVGVTWNSVKKYDI